MAAARIREGRADRVGWFIAADWAAPLVGRLAVEVRTDPAAARVDRGGEIGHGCAV